MGEGGTIKLTLTGSPIGRTQRQRLTLRGLGLTRVGKTVVVRDSVQTRGMIGKVAHLVRLEN